MRVEILAATLAETPVATLQGIRVAQPKEVQLDRQQRMVQLPVRVTQATVVMINRQHLVTKEVTVLVPIWVFLSTVKI